MIENVLMPLESHVLIPANPTNLIFMLLVNHGTNKTAGFTIWTWTESLDYQVHNKNQSMKVGHSFKPEKVHV